MITVCPHCALTLAVTAADLRLGQGQVRCGRCAAVFNALAALQEEDLEAADESPATPTLLTAADRGELAATASAPEAAVPSESDRNPVTAESDVRIPPQAQVVANPDADIDEEMAAQIDAEPLVAAEAEPVAANPALEFSSAANDAEASAPPSANDDSIEPVAANEELGMDDALDVEVESVVSNDMLTAQPEYEPIAAAPDADEVAASLTTDANESLDLDLTPAPRPRSAAGWYLGGVFLALLLGAQWVHANRNALSVSDNWRGPLNSLYGFFGSSVQPRWDPAAFDIRRRGEMVADNGGAMTLRATVQNTAAHSLPLPLLRVVLLDRFGKRIAARDLMPREYLPAAAAANTRMLAPGQRVDAEVALADPGPAASGYELDACLTATGGQLHCANQTKR